MRMDPEDFVSILLLSELQIHISVIAVRYSHCKRPVTLKRSHLLFGGSRIKDDGLAFGLVAAVVIESEIVGTAFNVVTNIIFVCKSANQVVFAQTFYKSILVLFFIIVK